jgi:hypothetical protein
MGMTACVSCGGAKGSGRDFGTPGLKPAFFWVIDFPGLKAGAFSVVLLRSTRDAFDPIDMMFAIRLT